MIFCVMFWLHLSTHFLRERLSIYTKAINFVLERLIQFQTKQLVLQQQRRFPNNHLFMAIGFFLLLT